MNARLPDGQEGGPVRQEVEGEVEVGEGSGKSTLSTPYKELGAIATKWYK